MEYYIYTSSSVATRSAECSKMFGMVAHHQSNAHIYFTYTCQVFIYMYKE